MDDLIAQFIEFMSSVGLSPANPNQIKITNGKWGNYALIGDKRGKEKGAYRLTIDGDGGVGQAKDRRVEEPHTWSSRAKKTYTPEEKAAFKERIMRMREEEAAKLEREREDASAAAKRLWLDSIPAIEHPYLTKKGIQPHSARITQEGLLILPRYDFKGKIRSYQTINHKGDKLFQPDGATTATYMPLANHNDDKSIMSIAEGFATGASIREATGIPVFVAFTSGNLLSVALGARRKYPDAEIIIAADNDAFRFKAPRNVSVVDIDRDAIGGDDPRWNEWRKAGYLENIGTIKALEAAHKINGRVVYPEFSSRDLINKPTDFNDLHLLYGLARVKEVFNTVPATNRNIAPNFEEDRVPDSVYQKELYNSMDWMDLCEFKNRSTGLLNKDYAMYNAEIILTHKPPIGGCLCFDEFRKKQTVRMPLPWDKQHGFVIRELDNNDIVRLQILLERDGIKMGKGPVNDIAKIACSNHSYNPAIEHLRSLRWDKKSRLDNWLAYYLGAEEQPPEYLSTIGRCWLIAAAKRVLYPGTPFHHMLVLEGAQGELKSTALRSLATFKGKGKDDLPISYFSDGLSFDMIRNRDLAVFACGKVILEFQELTGLGEKYINEVKQWITKVDDEYRHPYDVMPTVYPRTFVLAGTANSSQYIFDATGGRRFWGVRVGRIDIKAIENDREQLWAEAVYREGKGELWYIKPDDPVYGMVKVEQAARYCGDPWDYAIEDFIAHRDSVTITEIYQDLLRIDKEKWDNRSSARIGASLRSQGFERKTVRNKDTGKPEWRWVRMENINKYKADEEIPF